MALTLMEKGAGRGGSLGGGRLRAGHPLVREVAALAAFIKRMAASHVERLVGMT